MHFVDFSDKCWLIGRGPTSSARALSCGTHLGLFCLPWPPHTGRSLGMWAPPVWLFLTVLLHLLLRTFPECQPGGSCLCPSHTTPHMHLFHVTSNRGDSWSRSCQQTWVTTGSVVLSARPVWGCEAARFLPNIPSGAGCWKLHGQQGQDGCAGSLWGKSLTSMLR